MDLTGWLEFFVDSLATQLVEVKNRGEMAIRSDLSAKEHGLSPRQTAALYLLLSQGKLTIGDLEGRFPEISRRSLQRDIKAMLDKGLLQEVGHGPTDPYGHYLLREL